MAYRRVRPLADLSTHLAFQPHPLPAASTPPSPAALLHSSQGSLWPSAPLLLPLLGPHLTKLNPNVLASCSAPYYWTVVIPSPWAQHTLVV